MAMIVSSTMIADASPAVLPQLGGGEAAAQSPAGARFAGLLNSLTSSQEGSAPSGKTSGFQATEAPAQEAAQPQNTGVAAAATLEQQQPTADPGQTLLSAQQRTLGAFSWPGTWQNATSTGSTAQPQAATGPETLLANGTAAGKAAITAERFKALGDLHCATLAAEAEQDAAGLASLQGGGATLATRAEARKGAEPSTVTATSEEPGQDDLSAEAPKSDQALAAAALLILPALSQAAQHTVPEGSPSTAATVPTEIDSVSATANQASMQPGLQGPAVSPGGSASQQGPIAATEAAAQGADQEAKPTVVAQKAMPAAPAAQKVQERVAPGEEKILFSHVKSSDDLRKGEQPEPPKSAAAPNGTAPTKGTGLELQNLQVAEPDQQQTPAQSTGDANPSHLAQPAEARSQRAAAMSFHGTYSALAGVAEQAGAKVEASVEEAGIKGAAAAPTAKVATLQGNQSQNGAGAGSERHPEQKTAGETGSVLQAQGLGLRGSTEVEAAPSEAKPAATRSELHQSILAQIKDGVVTHDAKGNGEMSIRLNPGELGELKIQVRMDDNRVRIEVQADNRMVKDLLLSNLDSLKDSLSGKNFTMDGFNVSTGSGGSFGSLAEQRDNPQQQSFLRSARAGGYDEQEDDRVVNYLTGEANNLLDVRM